MRSPPVHRIGPYGQIMDEPKSLSTIWATVLLLCAGLSFAWSSLHTTADARHAMEATPAVGAQQHARDAQQLIATASASDPKAMELDIARLGATTPVSPEELRKEYLETDDLYGYVQVLLRQPDNEDGAAQYHIYLALEECRFYLGLDSIAAYAMYAKGLLMLYDGPADERFRWESEFARCKNFVDADLRVLEAAMDVESPGAAAEYGAVWLVRAWESDYGPALAEAALRSPSLDPGERLALLQRAYLSGHPDVYWQVFAQFADEDVTHATVGSVAWLIAACRAGADCSVQSPWFRNWISAAAGGTSLPYQRSAIEHYWGMLPPDARTSAYHLATRIEACRRSGCLASLPWPRLSARDAEEIAPEPGSVPADQ